MSGEVCEVESQRGAEDDVGRVTDECGSSAGICGATFRHHHGDRVKFQQPPKLKRERREKQHDRDAIHEHGHDGGEDDQNHEQRNRVIIKFLQRAHRQPGEETSFFEDGDQDEHACQ